MVKEAIDQSDNGKLTYREIKNYIVQKYGDVKNNSINCQIIVCTVNHPSRIHYFENLKPRQSNGKYDFLYTVGKGIVEKYNPDHHGMWEIYLNDQNNPSVRQIDDIGDACESTDIQVQETTDYTFAHENHLRDFIKKNLTSIDNNLSLYASDEGVSGVEFITSVGRIDILTKNKNDEFVVIELKLSRGQDAALGQLQRYMGWVKTNLSETNAPVHGVIIAKKIDEKLKYAVSVANNITLYEYEMNFDIRKTEL